MLGYILFFGLVMGTCCWILTPLFKKRGRQNDFTAKQVNMLEELKIKKNSAYAVIKELEFDLKMGKLTEEDFQILKRQYTQEAVGYMKEIDQLEASQATFSGTTNTSSEQDKPHEGTQIRNSEAAKRKYIYCTSCGEKHPFESLFCAACGSKLQKHQGSNLQEEN